MSNTPGDAHTTIQELKDLVIRFSEARNWGTHHTPKNLAMSIAIEAAELMEHFQWDEYSAHDKQEVADELGDILAYCFNLAARLDIDVASAYKAKLARAEQKYPVSLFNAQQDSPADYARIKKAYRAGKKSTG